MLAPIRRSMSGAMIGPPQMRRTAARTLVSAAAVVMARSR